MADRKQHRTSVVSTRWDDRAYGETRPLKPVDSLIGNLMNGAGERDGFEMAPELVEDTWKALYKESPVIREPQELIPETRGVQKFMTSLVEHPSLQEVQDYTAGDPMMSAVALQSLTPVLEDMLKRVQEEEKRREEEKRQQEEQKQQQKQKQQKQDGDEGDEGDEGDGPGGSDPGDGEGDAPGDGEGEGDGQPTQEEASWESMLGDIDIERVLYRALDAAKDEVEELDTLLKDFGVEDGEWAATDPTRRLAMAKKLQSPRMKQLAAVIGRMTRYAFGVKQTKINDVPHIVYDVERGRNLRNVLPREFALLGQPGARLDFMARYAQGNLTQYRKHGQEQVGKGPLVVCIDKSYSMDGAPFDWAMGAAEAMRRLGAEDGRDYYALFFGTNNDRHRFEFPKGEGSFDKIMAFCAVKADGGTQFDGVLEEALEKASELFYKEGRSQADIVFITDGESALTDEWVAGFNMERKATGVRVYSIFVSGAHDTNNAMGSRARALLERISDEVIPVTKLLPESVGSVFAKL